MNNIQIQNIKSDSKVSLSQSFILQAAPAPIHTCLVSCSTSLLVAAWAYLTDWELKKMARNRLETSLERPRVLSSNFTVLFIRSNYRDYIFAFKNNSQNRKNFFLAKISGYMVVQLLLVHTNAFSYFLRWRLILSLFPLSIPPPSSLRAWVRGGVTMWCTWQSHATILHVLY